MNSKANPVILQFEAFPGTIYKYSSLRSTNVFAKENCFPDFSVIWAEEQTAGRGRFEREWNALPRLDLTFSCLLPIKALSPHLYPNLTQITALAIAQFLEDYQLAPKIRWPNDVLVKRKKICGILCELILEPERKQAIVGIGININRSKETLKQINQPATSLFCELNQEFSLVELLNKLLLRLLETYQEFLSEGFLRFRERIKKRLTFTKEQIMFTNGNKKNYDGEIIDLNEDGTLLFRCKNGEIKQFSAGEISASAQSKERT